MAKEKVEQLKDKKKSLNYEVEIALVGVMIVIISLIGFLNQGFVGSIITYGLVYLFGCWYQVPLFLGLFFGGYFFIKRNKPKMISNINVLCCALLIVFLAIASSKYSGATLDNCFTFYKSAFEKCHMGIKIDLLSISQVGGGLIGYILYALLVSVLGEFMTNVVIVILVMSFAYFAFKNPLVYLYNKISEFIENKRNKDKSNKKEKIKKVSKKEN